LLLLDVLRWPSPVPDPFDWLLLRILLPLLLLLLLLLLQGLPWKGQRPHLCSPAISPLLLLLQRQQRWRQQDLLLLCHTLPRPRRRHCLLFVPCIISSIVIISPAASSV
jgi:hypothetical protein